MNKLSLLVISLLVGCSSNTIPDIDGQLMQQVMDLQTENKELRWRLKDKATWFNSQDAGTADENLLSEKQKQELIFRAKEAILLRRDDLLAENLVFTNSEETSWPDHSFYVHFQQIHKGQTIYKSHAAVEFRIRTDFHPIQRINAFGLLPPLD